LGRGQSQAPPVRWWCRHPAGRDQQRCHACTSTEQRAVSDSPASCAGTRRRVEILWWGSERLPRAEGCCNSSWVVHAL
ncbi:unnamed protein product, partial [Ectocarpus sp. 12 AP-2014]